MDDLQYIIGLGREEYESLGFIPFPKIKSYYLDHNRYIIQYDLKGKRVGYLLHGSIRPNKYLTVAQACIVYDFRRVGFGTDLVRTLASRAVSGQCLGIRLRCADDLASNKFWQFHGFKLIAIDDTPNKRNRLINLYYLDAKEWVSSRLLFPCKLYIAAKEAR